MENDFLNDFKNFLLQLPKVESGNFIKDINENIQQPVESFLHKLCRKIDIKKVLYVAYDERKDLTSTSDSVISNDDWLKVVYILSYWVHKEESLSIKYKALNSLLKTKDIMPKECLENKFINHTYSKIIKKHHENFRLYRFSL